MKQFFVYFFLIFSVYLYSQEILLHSHNDYLQAFPLKTALEYKANSIEVDVAWFGGEVKVSHFNFALKNKPDLETMYLKKMIEQKDELASVHFLMIDIKSGGEEILLKLNLLIGQYHEIFASRNEIDVSKIKVIISGAVNRKKITENNSLNFLFADGNPKDLDNNINSNLMPLVSANYTSLTKVERLLLIEKAHKQGKKVRFWNTKDTFKSWKKLLELKVDFIGVDNLKKYYRFVSNR